MSTEDSGSLAQIERIKELKHAYFRACDAKDPAAFRGCFVSTGSELDYGPMGSTDADGMCAVFRRIALHTDANGRYTVLDMHHGMHPVITLDGPGRATGRWSLRFRSLDLTQRQEKLLAGEYDDVYVVENGAWTIQRSAFHTLWSMTRAIPEGTHIEQSVHEGHGY